LRVADVELIQLLNGRPHGPVHFGAGKE
jgi:hypothetical protein